MNPFQLIAQFLNSQNCWKNLGKTRQTLLSGASSTFLVKVVGAFLTFTTQIFLARMMGAKDYGYFAYATSWMLLLAIPAQLGLRNSLIRFIPEYETKNMHGHIIGVMRFAIKRVALTGIIISLVFALLLLIIPDIWDKYQILSLAVMLFALPIFSLNRIREAGLRAFHRVALAFVPENIIRPLVLCFLCGIIFYLSGTLLAWQSWVCNLLAISVAFIVGSWWLINAVPKEIRKAKSENEIKKWISVSLPMLMLTGMNILLNKSSVIILGFFSPANEIGVYSACARIVLLVAFALSSVNSIAGPMISRLYYSDQKEELQKMLTFAAKGIFIITLLAVLFLVAAGEFILGLFGPDFIQGYLPLMILLSGQVVNALAGSVALLMNMTGHHKATVKIMFFVVTIHLIVNVLLILNFGIIGAAVASAISLVFWNAAMLIYVRKNIGLNPTIFFKGGSNV